MSACEKLLAAVNQYGPDAIGECAAESMNDSQWVANALQMLERKLPLQELNSSRLAGTGSMEETKSIISKMLIRSVNEKSYDICEVLSACLHSLQEIEHNEFD